MAKIHGIAYLTIGIMITAFSYYIKRGFQVFVYAGLLMIIIGIIKLVAKGVKKKKSKKPAHHPHHRLHQHAVYCSKCGAVLRATDVFCYKCGARR